MSATITNIADRIARKDKRHLNRQHYRSVHMLAMAILFSIAGWALFILLLMAVSR